MVQRGRVRSRVGKIAGTAALASLASLAALPVAPWAPWAPWAAAAPPCVRIWDSIFDAPGIDSLAANLNGEWVEIHNFCDVSQLIGGWRIHDEGRGHTYTFPAGLRIGAHRTITIHSGRGTNTAYHRYWGRSSGEVWNNGPREWAYLRRASGTLVSRWSEYARD